ncbi:MAG: hypothetical protein J0I07_34085 [Myxococcales bacterium]|nr:hypothetical protein [Myxococcales bacterium]
MTEMKRLLDEEISADVAWLLRSAETDGPAAPEPAQARALAVIVALPSVGRAAPASREGGRLSPLLRTGAWSALAVAVVFTGVVLLRSSSTAPVGSSSSRPEAPAATPASELPARPSSEGIRVEDLPSATEEAAGEASGGKSPARRRSPASEAPSRFGLEDELAAIDAARASLASGRPDAALVRVQGYQRTFRDGHFAEEADALEIQALAEMGRHAESRAKGERFLASRPGSPYERRVRSSIASDEVKP